MWPLKSQKRSRVALFLHDGDGWHAFVFAYGKARWRCLDRTVCIGRNPRQIPTALLDFAEQHQARRIRVALPQEVIALGQVELPVDASAEETQTVVALALTAETGQQFGTVRVCAAKADSFSMGGLPESLLACAFESSLLEQFEKTCHSVRIPFDGVGSLELATLAANARLNPDTRFLLLRRENGFYAIGATESLPMLAGGIALGSVPDPRGREPERLQRAAKRLETHAATPIVVCSTLPLSPEREAELMEIIGSAAQVVFADHETFLEEAASELAGNEDPDVPAGGGAVVRLGEEAVSPYRAGTWMFILMLIFAGLFVWSAHYKLTEDLAALQTKSDSWEALKAERKKQKDILAGIDANRAKYDKTIALLRDKNILPPSMVAILAELEQNMPPYTQLIKIEQTPEGDFLLGGHTDYQDAFLEILPQLNKKLTGVNMRVELKKLEKHADSRRQEFLVRVFPGEKK